jgi:hypothetical protein
MRPVLTTETQEAQRRKKKEQKNKRERTKETAEPGGLLVSVVGLCFINAKGAGFQHGSTEYTEVLVFIFRFLPDVFRKAFSSSYSLGLCGSLLVGPRKTPTNIRL